MNNNTASTTPNENPADVRHSIGHHPGNPCRPGCTGYRGPALLPLSHPTHLRRLCREINGNPAGVYLSGTVAGTPNNPRLCGRATLHKNTTARGEAGHLICFPVGSSRVPFYIHADKLTEETFIDGGSGRSICASRQPSAKDKAAAPDKCPECGKPLTPCFGGLNACFCRWGGIAPTADQIIETAEHDAGFPG